MQGKKETQESVCTSFYRSDNALINDAVDRLAVRVYTYRKQFERKTVLLTGCGSSNGTSMIAINLALALSQAGWKTLLVDADLRKGPEYKRAAKETEKGLADFLRSRLPIGEIVHATNQPNLKYVPCGTSDTNAALLLCSESMSRFIEEMSREYDFVIFDCPSVTVVPDASILFLQVGGIALVAALNATTKKQLSTAKRAVEKLGDKYYGLIINCVDKQQYRHYFPQQGYFDSDALVMQHKKWMQKEKAAHRQEGKQ